jgi:tRNA nucleotidyltransferase (CCA-adding enzyme)
VTSPPSDLMERLRALPGIGRLLPALEGLDPCYLVGGAVRDVLLGAAAVDLDVAVEGDAEAVGLHLAERLGGEVRAHGRFGTATVRAPGLQVDLAGTRRERYSAPGALPDVEPATLDEDLGRRDFTINAMAMSLSHDDLGAIHDPHGGREDLDERLVRILHATSFVDDPTRLLRAARYAARFGFTLEAETAELAREAAASSALGTVSGPRIRDELIDLLAEGEAPEGVRMLRDLDLCESLHPALVMDAERVASAKLGAIETAADPAHAALAVLCLEGPDEVEEWVDRLALPAGARDAVMRAARRGPALADELARRELAPSELHALLYPEPPESLALALALGAPADRVLDFVSRLRGIRLEITGADLLAAGVPESPALGEALEQTLRRKLDGEVGGRDAELRMALDIARTQA